MRPCTARRGTTRERVQPDWNPLELTVAPRHLDDFMWMFEVELDDGAVLQAYKHRETRGYLHLSAEGDAFIYEYPDRYLRVTLSWLLDEVLPETDGR